jgi:hypothetical protein
MKSLFYQGYFNKSLLQAFIESAKITKWLNKKNTLKRLHIKKIINKK